MKEAAEVEAEVMPSKEESSTEIKRAQELKHPAVPATLDEIVSLKASRAVEVIEARVGIAAVHALRGDKEAAYDWLQQAIDSGFYQYAELERHPCFESLHGEERFQQMMDGVKARVEEMRRQVDAMEAGG